MYRIVFMYVFDVFLLMFEVGKVDVDVYFVIYKVDFEDVCWNVFEAMMDFIYTGIVGLMFSF